MRLMTTSLRRGCSFFSSTARSKIACCLVRGRPRSLRGRRNVPSTPSFRSRCHQRRSVREQIGVLIGVDILEDYFQALTNGVHKKFKDWRDKTKIGTE